MIISVLIRGFTLVCGYVYPAYECYKTVERNKPEVEQLRFWCQYWILVAILTVCERVGDAFISWVPMYGEAKLAFIIYLWYPKTKGAIYVYDSFFRPYVAKHESDIDRNLSELKIRAGDITVVYWQRALSYVQTRVFDILQYIAAQSATAPPPPPAQPQGHVPRNQQESARLQQSSGQEPPSNLPNSSASQPKKDTTQEAGPSCAPKETPSNATQESDTSVSTSRSVPANAEEMEVEGYEVVSMPPDANPNPTPRQSATEVSREEIPSSIRDNRLRNRRPGPNQR